MEPEGSLTYLNYLDSYLLFILFLMLIRGFLITHKIIRKKLVFYFYNASKSV